MAGKVTFNEQQGEAVLKVTRWLRRWAKASYRDRVSGKVPQVFRLFGYAGTGKTTLASFLAQLVTEGDEKIPKGRVLFSAYTGKAASRLIMKGNKESSTIHSLIYHPVIDDDTGRVLGFTLNHESPLKFSALLIVDEVSMVNEEIARHLLSFGIPILCLGDPGQLPPVEGEGWFINAVPDYMLTDVARQAKDSPIIHLATLARLGKEIEYGRYSESVLVLPSDRSVADKYLNWADQVLCGTNVTRKGLNLRMRELSGKSRRDPVFPVKGEKLICLKNNAERGLLNGTSWVCSKPEVRPMKILTNYKEYRAGLEAARWADSRFPALWFKAKSLDLQDSNGDPLIVRDIQVSAHMFNPNLPEPPYREMANAEQFDFGGCITTHKAQGSEWKNLMLVNESHFFREHAEKHLYTGITRAQEGLVLRL
jgi:exodeoxyribonuclease V